MPILNIDESYNVKSSPSSKNTSVKPILHDNTSNISVPPEREYVTQEQMKTSTLYNKERSLDKIIKYIRGMKWTVNYFLQLVDVNDTTNLPDISLPRHLQKYSRINNLDIILQTAIDHGNVDDISGEAIINAGFTPNLNDVFIVTLTGGREAVFFIDNVETRTYNLHEIYYVSFKLFKFLDDDANLYNMLLDKVVKDYSYDKDHIMDFSAPIISTKDYEFKKDLSEKLYELKDYYFDKFINKDRKLISLPTKGNAIYTDALLTEFIYATMDIDVHPDFKDIRRVDVGRPEGVDITLWDVILRRDINLLSRAEKYLGFKHAVFDRTHPVYKRVNYLGPSFIIDKISSDSEPPLLNITDISKFEDTYGVPRVYGNDSSLIVTEEVEETIEEEIEVEEEITKYEKVEVIDPNKGIPKKEVIDHNKPEEPKEDKDIYKNLPVIRLNSIPVVKQPEKKYEMVPVKEIVKVKKKVPKKIKKKRTKTIDNAYQDIDGKLYVFPIKNPDNCYVMSNSFYLKDLSGCGALEELVIRYLKGESLNTETVESLANQYYNWSTTEQYYLIPILILLIKDTMNNLYMSL